MKTDENKRKLKTFWGKYKKGIYIVGGTVGTAVLGYWGVKRIPNFNIRSIVEPTKKIIGSVDVLEEPELMFKGVPLSKLDELAKKIYHGIGCSIDQSGFLVFKHKSNRGHQTFRPQMCVENGKLINLGGHFPNQWWSTADEFAKQANEMFELTE